MSGLPERLKTGPRFDSSDPKLLLYAKRSRLLLLFLGAVALTANGLWVALQLPALPLGLVGWFGVAFFGLGAVVLAKRLVIRRPILVVDRQGIVDAAQFVAAGRIDWEEIEAVSISATGKQRFLGIHVRDVAALEARKSPLHRWVIRANARFGHAPVTLPQSLLPMPVEQLAAWLQDALDARPFA